MKINEILLKTKYFINFNKVKNTLIFSFPNNKNLNLDRFTLFYTIKPYGLLIRDYTKRRIECPDYSIKAILFTDFLVQCKIRDMPNDTIFKNSVKTSLNKIPVIETEKEQKLLKLIIEVLENKEYVIDKDIEEGFNKVIDFIQEKVR